MTEEQLAYLAASICVSYGAVPQKVADHMTVESFKKYPKKLFIDTMLIGAEMHGYEAKINEFREKLSDPRFDCLFGEDIPDEEIVDPIDLPDDVVIKKEEDIDGNEEGEV